MGTRAGAAGAFLTAGLAVSPDRLVAGFAHPQATLELRVITYASLDARDVDVARLTATALLATAGLQIAWRECSGDACAVASDGPPSLLVCLLPLVKRSDPAAAGEVVRDPATHAPTVLVYVTRIGAVIRSIRRSAAGRSSPELSSLAMGQVVGLTIAHEVGHSLGLGHSASGPMRAQAAPEDFIALQRSMLRFPPITLDERRGFGFPPAGGRRFPP
jgi:hypothetical protein